MAKRAVSPIMTWIFWSILVLGVFLTVTWEYFVAGFSADTSKITWIIMGFFLLGLAFSLRAAFHLQREFKSLDAMNVDQRIVDANASDVAAMFDAAMERVRRGDRIDVRNLVSAYAMRLKAQMDNIGVVSGMLITIGLLGTVVGLIYAITGMDAVLQSNSADFAAMKSGLNRTVRGLGTAFYTTFFGALLGGVVLKVLNAEMKKSAAMLVSEALRFSELHIAPQFAKKASETLTELEDRVQGLHQHLGSLGDSVGAVIETLDSKHTALASGLGGLVAAVEKANEEAATRSAALVDAVDRKVDETNRLADERLRAIIESVALSGADANTRMNALVETVNQTIESTNRLADERLNALVASLAASNEEASGRANALVGAVGQSIEETNRLADERLKLMAGTIEEANQKAEERLMTMMERIGHVVDDTHNQANERLSVLSEAVNRTTEETHRLADERLQALVRAVETAAQQTHQKSEAHLISFVEAVDLAMDKSRRHAERSLDAKAANLAHKLNEAATVLSSLMGSPDVAINVESEPVDGE